MTKGSCLCGEVRFEVTKCSMDIYKCHCSKCRKNFGAASSAATFVKEYDFNWISGEENLTYFELNPGYSKRFCKTCGSVVPSLIPSRGIYWVPAGLFDDDPGVSLQQHIYVASKAPWEVLDEQTDRLDEGFEF